VSPSCRIYFIVYLSLGKMRFYLCDIP